MAKKMEESKVDFESLGSLDIDDNLEELPMKEVEIQKVEKPIKANKNKEKTEQQSAELINCLRNERIVIRYIPRETAMVHNPKHVLYGGMAENAVRTFVVPKLSSGMFVNVLTDSEKAYLEEIMGLEYNALSIYKKVDNFWDDSNEAGISRVRLSKQDNILDLSSPEDYIRYKILLANKDFIAPSLQALSDCPKATYQFVIVTADEETKQNKLSMSNTMKCYKEYGKIEEDKYTLRVIVETIDGRPTNPNVKLDFLQTKINNLIQADSKTFLKIITDPLLPTKVLIKKCIEDGIIAMRGNYFYLKSDNSPLCEVNEEPTLNVAAKYLSSPKRQDLKFTLEAKLKM